MDWIVIKFGGSTFKNENDILKILSVLKRYRTKVVIVVSAFYGVTSKIEKILFENKSTDAVADLLFDLEQKCYGFLLVGKPDVTNKNLISEEFDKRIETLKRLLLQTITMETILPSLVDEILVLGEKISSHILTMILKSNDYDVIEKLPENIGIMTDGVYGGAQIDMNSTMYNIQKTFEGADIYVVPGFYGISKTKEITTLGRDGSDYTASILAVSLNAKTLELWKDTDGINTADPKLIHDTKTIEYLSYDEAQEFAFSEASILHSLTIRPLLDKKIEVKLFNIDNCYDAMKPYTVISKRKNSNKNYIKGISYKHNITLFTILYEGEKNKKNITSIFNLLFDKQIITPKNLITTRSKLSFYLDSNSSQKIEDINQICTANNMQSPRTQRCTQITIVGSFSTNCFKYLTIVDTLLKKNRIQSDSRFIGSNKLSLNLLINENILFETIQLIHNELIGSKHEIDSSHIC